MTTVVIISFVTMLPAPLSLPTFCPKTNFRDVFRLRHTILAAAAVSSLHNKHNLNGTNIITVDLAETKDWKDVMKEESVLNYKNGVDKYGTKQAEEIDEDVQPLHYRML